MVVIIVYHVATINVFEIYSLQHNPIDISDNFS